MKNLKDIFLSSLGAVGLVIWYLMSAIIMFLPLAFLELPFFVDVLIILAITSIPFIGDVLEFIIWVWSFVVVLSIPIDGWSIFYFFALAFYFFTKLLPYVVNIVISLISAIIVYFTAK